MGGYVLVVFVGFSGQEGLVVGGYVVVVFVRFSGMFGLKHLDM